MNAGVVDCAACFAEDVVCGDWENIEGSMRDRKCGRGHTNLTAELGERLRKYSSPSLLNIGGLGDVKKDRVVRNDSMAWYHGY